MSLENSNQQKKVRTVCDWCHKSARHWFDAPDLALCCACTDVAIEHSALVIVPNQQQVSDDAMYTGRYDAVARLMYKAR